MSDLVRVTFTCHPELKRKLEMAADTVPMPVSAFIAMRLNKATNAWADPNTGLTVKDMYELEYGDGRPTGDASGFGRKNKGTGKGSGAVAAAKRQRALEGRYCTWHSCECPASKCAKPEEHEADGRWAYEQLDDEGELIYRRLAPDHPNYPNECRPSLAWGREATYAYIVEHGLAGPDVASLDDLPWLG